MAVGVVSRAGRGVAAGDYVAHVEAAPGQAREVAAVVEGEVLWVGDVVCRAGVLLVLGVALGAVFLLTRLLSCKKGLDDVAEGEGSAGALRWPNILNLRWAMRFWMRLLSSGSVTSVQSSVFFLPAADMGLSLLVDEECLEILDEDISEDSFSVSEPDWLAVVLVVVLLPFRLLRLFPDRAEDGVECLLWPDVDECRVLWSASSHSLSESYECWTWM